MASNTGQYISGRILTNGSTEGPEAKMEGKTDEEILEVLNMSSHGKEKTTSRSRYSFTENV